MKKTPLGDAVYLAHISEAIKAIKNYVKLRLRKRFLKETDRKRAERAAG